MGYSFSTQSNPIYCGIKLLTPHNLIVNSMDNVSGGAGGIDISDGFTTAEKYLSLSSNRHQAGATASTGNDIVQVVSAGPFNMAPDDSVVVAFALLAGDNLMDLKAGAAAAQQKYDSLYAVGIIENTTQSEFLIFPNPASENISMHYVALAGENISFELINPQGVLLRKIPSFAIQKPSSYHQVINLSGIPAGMYLLKFQSQYRSITRKIVIGN